MARDVKRGDTVVVLSGDERGKTGKITRVEGALVFVEGVNLQYKHMKRSQKNPKGGRVRREGAMHRSKVMLWSEKEKKGQRFRVETRDGKRVRVGVKDNAVLD